MFALSLSRPYVRLCVSQSAIEPLAPVGREHGSVSSELVGWSTPHLALGARAEALAGANCKLQISRQFGNPHSSNSIIMRVSLCAIENC